MTQAQLERAVCRATGESRDLIRRRRLPPITRPEDSRPASPSFRPRQVATETCRRREMIRLHHGRPPVDPAPPALTSLLIQPLSRSTDMISLSRDLARRLRDLAQGRGK